eukprot:6337655-Prymnesium_polylepis.1
MTESVSQLCQPVDADDASCAICLVAPDYLEITACGHRFCAPCLRQYVQLRTTWPVACPLCKQA